MQKARAASGRRGLSVEASELSATARAVLQLGRLA
jgi:hypothetical protein